MLEVEYSPESLKDLHRVVEFVEVKNPYAARRIAIDLQEGVSRLELWSNLVYEHQAVFLSDCSITCSPSWNLTLLTTRVSS